jgi:hypothetical protein
MIVSPADFGKLIVNETEKWGKVVKRSGATSRGPAKGAGTFEMTTDLAVP